MNLIRYVQKNGIRHFFNVLYKYKIDRALCKILSIILKKVPLKNIVIIVSHNDFDCNGGALYDYLIKHNYNKKYKIVWLLRNEKPSNLPDNVECLYLFRPSIRKAYYLCVAKYYFADMDLPKKLREDQISCYLTHGGIVIKNVRGLINMTDDVDYVLSSSPNYDEIMAKTYSMPYPDKRMIHVGYPSNDVLFIGEADEIYKITSKCYKKVILWMPTFRKLKSSDRNDSIKEQPLGIPLVESVSQLKHLNEILFELDVLLIIKIHPMQDLTTIRDLQDMTNIKILTGENVKKLDVDNYRLMKCADAFISDYSSAIYSYLLLNRPIAFVLSDEKDYKLGMVETPVDFLVGEKIYTFEDFLKFIEDVYYGRDEYTKQREELMDWLYSYRDGKSCERLVKFLNM